MVKPRLGEGDIKRHRFRNTALAALAAALVSLLPAVASADTTLKFISWQVDEDGTGDWWKEAIAKFESENPGVTNEFTKVDRGNCADTMTTLFAGGEPPQIVHLASFECQNFAENGWMEHLDPWLEADGIDFTGWAGQGTCRWNGETACVMLLYFGFMMAHNAEILAAEGLDVPTTYAEFLDVARKTTKDLNGEGIIDQFGTVHRDQGRHAGQYLAEMLNYLLDAGSYWTKKQGEVTIDTPEMIEGLTRWRTVIKEGLTPIDLSSREIRTFFADGKIVLRLDGPWLYSTMKKGAAFEQLAIAVRQCPRHLAVLPMYLAWQARCRTRKRRWCGNS